MKNLNFSIDEWRELKTPKNISKSILSHTINCASKVKHKKPVLSLILPVFNEADIISENLRVIDDFLRSTALSYEIIVCDDCSTDGTRQKINSLLAEKPNILLLSFSKRVGKGGSIKKSIDLASGEIIVFMDADLSADLPHIIEFVNILRAGNYIVIGERSILNRFTQGFFRVILSLTYNALVNLLFRTGIKDHQCGFKGFRMDVAKILVNEISNNDFIFDTELIIKARNLGIPIKAVPIRWCEKRLSKNRNLRWIKNALIMMRDLLILKLRD
jgi:glycosyltransferase involved in cell wall biosynthesis